MINRDSQGAPLISVVTVVLNAVQDLPLCLESVACQEGVNYEHWVIDGASRDGTQELLRDKSALDNRLHWISEADKGIYDAMNKAVDHVDGRWIYFLGADDRLKPGSLREMSEHLHDPRTIYYGDVWKVHARQRYAGRFGHIKLALKNICQQAVFYPRAVFEKHSFDLTYRIQADWVMNMACWRDVSLKFKYVPLVVADYNDEGGVSSQMRDYAIEKNYVPLLIRHFPARVAVPIIAAVWCWRGLKHVRCTGDNA
jgi:glycosyltransferase involved in cell wall biosynthesis